MKKYMYMSALLMLTGAMYAQEVPQETLPTPPQEEPKPMPEPEEPKLSVKPIGRVLLDAGVFSADKEDLDNQLNDGFAIPDARAGVSAKYGDWSAKVDVGFALGKVGLKDIFIQKKFGEHSLLRMGYFVHQFGLQSATSSSFKISMEEPMSQGIFGTPRLLGAMFVYDNNDFLGTFSYFSETEAMKQSSDKTGNQGVGALTRLVYRPLREPGKIFHVGMSGAIESPRYNKVATENHKSFEFGVNFPTRIAKVDAIHILVPNAKNLIRLTPELTAAKGRLGIEAQYYYMQVARNNGMKDFHASGAYCSLRGLLRGDDYTYTHVDSGIDTPSPGAMELVLGYNYTDLSDSKADLLGGRTNDYSLTYNYYINKYMIWRVRASYTTAGYRSADQGVTFLPNANVAMLETRLQIKF